MAENEAHVQIHAPHDSALSVESDDAVKVRQLEAEVQDLAEKASNASQRFADYENEIRVLQAQLRQQQRRSNAAPVSNGENGDVAQAVPVQPEKPGISRFGSFMHSRKASAMQPNATTSSTREKELEAALVKEQTLRIAAEKKTKDLTAEIEELSESLFSEANEMVAKERKENAMLVEKVEVLEREVAESSSDAGSDKALRRENAQLRERLKALEQRDADRRRRLERLEGANKRIESVKAMLIPR